MQNTGMGKRRHILPALRGRTVVKGLTIKALNFFLEDLGDQRFFVFFNLKLS